jgi:hypothetical protein
LRLQEYYSSISARFVREPLKDACEQTEKHNL